MGAAVPAWAAIDNPGFETGTLQDWSSSSGGGNGAVSVVTSSGPWSAAEGTYFALLETDTGAGSNAVTTLSQQVYLSAGAQVSLQYFFQDDARSYSATASVALVNGAPISVLDLYGTGDETPDSDWVAVTSDPVAATGTYEISVTIRDGGTSVKRAMLGVDDFAATGAGGPGPAGPVPEPMTMVAGFLSLAGVAGYMRKRRMK
jgi:hypothetical protein